jgi:hypothetical protein
MSEFRYYTIVGTAIHDAPCILGPCMTAEQIIETAARGYPAEPKPLDLAEAITKLNRGGCMFEIYKIREESLPFVMRALGLGLGNEAVFLTRQRIFEVD